MPNVLALETSTAQASVAICAGSKVLASEASSLPKTHSEFFNPAIERCLSRAGLQLSDIELFAAGSGPGSFTGLRVSASIIKTFSMTYQKPMVAVDSLTLLKEEARVRGAKDTKILCMLNAHKNMNYVALFSKDSIEIPPKAMTISELNQLKMLSDQPVLCVGEGFTAYQNQWTEPFLSQVYRDSRYSDVPLAQTLAIFGQIKAKLGQTIEWNSYEPLYIRASEAEENLKLKSY
jgi:tRNA threonylcarbamoyladenosine biosynthesis protein TsaB